jgi:hypothetical protein
MLWQYGFTTYRHNNEMTLAQRTLYVRFGAIGSAQPLYSKTAHNQTITLKQRQLCGGGAWRMARMKRQRHVAARHNLFAASSTLLNDTSSHRHNNELLLIAAWRAATIA